MVLVEQFASTQIVSYDGVPLFAYDMATQPSTRLGKAQAAARLQAFAANLENESSAPAIRARAQRLAEAFR